jgi:hypothetical protein
MMCRFQISLLIICLVVPVIHQSCIGKSGKKSATASVYEVLPCNLPPEINADWSKEFWKNTESVSLRNYMGPLPAHFPDTRVKMRYDKEHLYLIFNVEDQFVRAVAKKTNDKVWQDSCVEFFFTPGNDTTIGYFNLEINCKGVFLFKFHNRRTKNEGFVDSTDLCKIDIAHSLKENVEEEKTNRLVWTIEYSIPVSILGKYMKIENPTQGTQWKANFYKCGDMTSHPHWLTWAPVNYPKPRFHLPEFFGTLDFK